MMHQHHQHSMIRHTNHYHKVSKTRVCIDNGSCQLDENIERIDEIPLEEDDRLFMDGYVNVQRPNHASQQSLATKRPPIPITTTDITKRQRIAAQQQPSSSLRRMPDYLPEEMDKGYGDMPRSTALNDMYRRINEVKNVAKDHVIMV